MHALFLLDTEATDTHSEYGMAGQVTDDIKIRRMLFSCWIRKATDTHSVYGMAGQVTDDIKIRRMLFSC